MKIKANRPIASTTIHNDEQKCVPVPLENGLSQKQTLQLFFGQKDRQIGSQKALSSPNPKHPNKSLRNPCDHLTERSDTDLKLVSGS
jgi:hypothetical protein